MMANTTASGRLRSKTGRLTITQVNAGTLVVPPRPDKAYIVVGGWFVSTGSAADVTSVDVVDQTGTVAVAVAVGNLTTTTHAPFNAASGVVWTTYGVALTNGEGIKIHTSTGTLGTTTQLDYCIEYLTVDPQ
jgi:hypothetical protein